MTDSFVVGVGGGQNWEQSYAGSGFSDGAAQLVKAIQDGDWLSAGANTAAMGMDLLAFVDNPVKAIGTSAVGWLLEHVSFLDWWLDHTTGDPNAVQNAAETFFQAAQALDGVAGAQIRSYGTDVDGYRAGGSASAVEFERHVGGRGDELRTLSLQCLGLGHTMNIAGVLVATCRGLFRDILAEFAWGVLEKATIALAAAPYTGGGSLGALLTDTLIEAANRSKQLAEKLTTLVKDLGGLFDRLRKLIQLLGSPQRRVYGLTMLKNVLPSVAKGVDDAVGLTAADTATAEVAAEDRADADRRPPAPFPGTDPRPQQGPGLGARWTATGTLDE